MADLGMLRPLTGAEEDVLWCLFRNGPTWDGNVPSKSGRDDLYEKGLIDRYDGWQWLTRNGVMLSMGMGFDRKKDAMSNRVPK